MADPAIENGCDLVAQLREAIADIPDRPYFTWLITVATLFTNQVEALLCQPVRQDENAEGSEDGLREALAFSFDWADSVPGPFQSFLESVGREGYPGIAEFVTYGGVVYDMAKFAWAMNQRDFNWETQKTALYLITSLIGKVLEMAEYKGASWLGLIVTMVVELGEAFVESDPSLSPYAWDLRPNSWLELGFPYDPRETMRYGGAGVDPYFWLNTDTWYGVTGNTTTYDERELAATGYYTWENIPQALQWYDTEYTHGEVRDAALLLLAYLDQYVRNVRRARIAPSIEEFNSAVWTYATLIRNQGMLLPDELVIQIAQGVYPYPWDLPQYPPISPEGVLPMEQLGEQLNSGAFPMLELPPPVVVPPPDPWDMLPPFFSQVDQRLFSQPYDSHWARTVAIRAEPTDDGGYVVGDSRYSNEEYRDYVQRAAQSVAVAIAETYAQNISVYEGFPDYAGFDFFRGMYVGHFMALYGLSGTHPLAVAMR